MNDPLMDTAYTLARQHYQKASQSVFLDLSAQFSDTDFNTVQHTAERALHLHLAAMEFSRKVWAGNLTSAKAEEMLQKQFHDFPVSTCQRAFASAYTETR